MRRGCHKKQNYKNKEWGGGKRGGGGWGGRGKRLGKKRTGYFWLRSNKFGIKLLAIIVLTEYGMIQ